MFLIMGISQKEKMLDFRQLFICTCCGQYDQIEVWMRYSYFMLFFIPIFKWNRHYYVRMRCCDKIAQLNEDIGRAIARGDEVTIDINTLDFGCGDKTIKICEHCGYSTTDDFQFCPKCGNKL